MKPSYISGISIALALFATHCTVPTSTRAYIPYVQPQKMPQAVRQKYRVIKKLEAEVTRYIKPRRKDYSSEKAFRKACKMNGTGERTIFGEKPYDGLAAANLMEYTKGTKFRIKGSDEILTVGDRCAKAEEEFEEDGTIIFDLFSSTMNHKQALAWGRRSVTVEILEENL